MDSHTVSMAVQSSVSNDFAAGVHAAPSDAATVQKWMSELSNLNGGFTHTVGKRTIHDVIDEHDVDVVLKER